MPQELNTKELIFRKSIHLFADDGYELVSMRRIADSSGIHAASIYNHYKSKEEILASIYQYYLENCFKCRISREEYLPILKRGTVLEILDIFNYPMPDEQDPEPLMFDIIRILWSRIHTDDDARDLYRKYVVDEAYRHIDEVMGEGIRLGRIAMKQEDVYTFASLLLAARNYVASSIPLYPDVERWRNTGTAMLYMLSGILKLNPPLV